MNESRKSARTALLAASAAIAASGRGLMGHVLPVDMPPERWRRYPVTGVSESDAGDGSNAALCYYHCHARDDDNACDDNDEHGHFHLFLPRRAMARSAVPLIAPPGRQRPRPSAVHIAALSIGHDGLPRRWLATNRWVTREWLYPAAAIVPLLGSVCFTKGRRPALVADWLAAMVAVSVEPIASLLAERDRRLITAGLNGENRAIEMVASVAVDFAALID